MDGHSIVRKDGEEEGGDGGVGQDPRRPFAQRQP